MATIHDLQNARRQQRHRERQKRKRKVVSLEIPVDMPVHLTEAEAAELFRTFSLEERLGLGEKLELAVHMALNQIGIWHGLARLSDMAPGSKTVNEVTWCGYRISGPALVKAKEIVSSHKTFGMSIPSDDSTNITDAKDIYAHKDYVSMLRTFFQVDVLLLYKEHVLAKGFRWNPYGLSDSKLDEIENMFSKLGQTVN